MLRVPGKLILFGEYAVLEGHPALVCAIDRFVEVRYSEAHHLRVEAPTIGIYEPTSARYELPFIEAVAEGLSAPTGIFVIDLRRSMSPTASWDSEAALQRRSLFESC